VPGPIETFETTPNPNALKCVLNEPLRGTRALHASRSIRGYTAPGPPASEDELAAALFEIPGIVSILINPAWVTIGKEPIAEWNIIKTGVNKALRAIEET
jgi:hypothetical protein